jgi:AraC family transcriptional regulator, transcriptional activator of pobA
MKTLKDLPVFTISNFEDYNHCQHCGNTFYIRIFDKHLLENTFIDKPHGHDFFILLLITHGSGSHHIDFNSYEVKPGTIFFLSPGQVHHWNLSQDVNGYILFFTKEYLLVDFNDHKMATLPFFLNQRNEPYVHLKDSIVAEMRTLFEKIDGEYRKKKRFYHEMIRLNLKMLLIALERSYTKKPMHHLLKYQENQIQKLESLIDENFKTFKTVSVYADRMNISIKQLNTLCKKAFNKNPSDLIQERVILEAKRLLVHTDHPICTIADLLNYSDSSYFIRLFKKLTTQTPEQFRANKVLEYYK